MNNFTSYIYLILVIKFAFIVMALTHLYLKLKGQANSELDQTILYWKERFEFIFIFLMSLLLIYLFNPRKPNLPINFETKLLLFLFGFVLLITAKWETFFKESTWFLRLQQIIGKNN